MKDRKKTVGVLAMLIMVAGLVLACPAKKKLVIMDADSISGASLWTYITEDASYTSWEMWPGKQAFYEGTSPHGKLLTTYVNDVGYNAAKLKLPRYPHGTVIVKENYKPDKNLAAITVMAKVPYYNPSAGNWFWAKYGPQGQVQKSGKVKGCIDCHRDAKKTDWVFTSR